MQILRKNSSIIYWIPLVVSYRLNNPLHILSGRKRTREFPRIFLDNSLIFWRLCECQNPLKIDAKLQPSLQKIYAPEFTRFQGNTTKCILTYIQKFISRFVHKMTLTLFRCLLWTSSPSLFTLVFFILSTFRVHKSKCTTKHQHGNVYFNIVIFYHVMLHIYIYLGKL